MTKREKGEKRSTKKEILEYFKDINYAYNDSTRYDTLERMLSELEGEKMGNEERCVICGEIIPEGRQVCPICEARAGLSTEWEKRQFPPDYIDRRKLTAKMRELISTRLFNEEDMLDLVNEQPRADVVEVIKCRACRNYCKEDKICWITQIDGDGRLSVVFRNVFDDFYCGYAERRKDNGT